MLIVYGHGNLIKDPEIKEISFSGEKKKVCNFAVAINKYDQEKAPLINMEVWNKLGESCFKNLKKGSGVAFSGDLEIERYKKDGEDKTALKIVNPKLHFTDRRADND